jgi:hypothetical protein
MYQKTSTARKPYARKNASPQQQLNAAIDRAQANNVTVAGAGTLTNGKPFWIVASQSVPGMMHVVQQTGKSLQCDCFASQNGKVCVHRAATYLYLTGKAKEAVEAARKVATAPVAASRPADASTPQPAAPALCKECGKNPRDGSIFCAECNAASEQRRAYVRWMFDDGAPVQRPADPVEARERLQAMGYSR